MDLFERTREFPEGVFTGGPEWLFETAGRMQLILLLWEGLRPDSRVLDVGCGCLRGGYWLIHFLRPGRYCGLEPDTAMVEAGLAHLLEPGIADEKRPRFEASDAFDFSVFGETFDYVIARSIWTHAAKRHIETMLESFLANSAEDAVFLASFRPPRIGKPEHHGDAWLGRSHASETADLARHSLKWIKSACRERGLAAKKVGEGWLHFGGQTWVRIKRAGVERRRGVRTRKPRPRAP